MINYKDIVFCDEKTCKHFGNGCDRAYTEEQRIKAYRWWNTSGQVKWEDPPICFELERPDCYEPEK